MGIWRCYYSCSWFAPNREWISVSELLPHTPLSLLLRKRLSRTQRCSRDIGTTHGLNEKQPGCEWGKSEVWWQVRKCGLVPTWTCAASTSPWYSFLSTDALAMCFFFSFFFSCTWEQVSLVVHLSADLVHISGHHPVGWKVSDCFGLLDPAFEQKSPDMWLAMHVQHFTWPLKPVWAVAHWSIDNAKHQPQIIIIKKYIK